MKSFDLQWISKYRDELFGIAILSVIFFHFGILHVDYYKNGSGVLYMIIRNFRYYFASSGVDIFAFLSGVGLYYSFSSNNNIARYYSRRMKRILIPYAIVGAIFWVQHDIVFMHTGIERLIKDFTYVTFFTEGVNNLWFVFFIGTMYLIFPIIYKLTFETRYGPLIYCLILAAVIIIPIRINCDNPELFLNIDKAITRVPAFVLGIPAGKSIKNGVKLPHIPVIGIIVIGFVSRYYAVQADVIGWESRYSVSCFAISAMLLFTYLLRAIDGAILIRKALAFFGRYSLEIYLLHISMWEFMGVAKGIPLHRASRWLMLTCATIAPLLSYVTSVIGEKIMPEQRNSRINKCLG